MANRSFGYTFFIRDMFGDGARKIKESIGDIDKSMTQLGRTADKASARTDRSSEALAGLRRNFRQLAGAYIGGQTFRHILKETASVEDGLNKVMSLIRDPADPKAYAAKIKAIISETQKLGKSVAEVSDALALQVQTMGANDASFTSFRAGVKLSIAAFLPLEQSISSVNKLMENFGQLSADPARAAQLLFTTRQLTNDFEGVLGALPEVAPLAGKAGMQPEQSLGMLAVFADRMKSAGSGAGAMSEILATLSIPGNKKQAALLRSAGIVASPEALAREGLEAQLGRLLKVGQREPQLLAGMGISGPGVKLLTQKLRPEDIPKIGELAQMHSADAAKGTIEGSFTRVQGSISSEMAQTREALNKLAVTIGVELVPPVKAIANYLQGSAVSGAVRGLSGGINALADPPHKKTRSSPLGGIIGMPLDFLIGMFRSAGAAPAGPTSVPSTLKIEVGVEKGATARVVPTGSSNLDVGTQPRG